MNPNLNHFEKVLAILLLAAMALGILGGFVLIYEAFHWFAKGAWTNFYLSFLGGVIALCVSGFILKSAFTAE